MISPMNFERLVSLCQQTHDEIQKRAVRAVDLSLVVRNWLFGYYVVEFEQNGADRAAYGKGLLQALADRLKALGIKGIASTNLKLSRQFYTVFRQIGQTASDQFTAGIRIGQTAPDQLPPSTGPVPPLRPTLSDELMPMEASHLNLSDIFASKYQLYLPSKEELKAQLESITASLEGNQP